MARLLVAEDSDTILLLLQKRLEMAGHEVVAARDGQEAVDAAVGAAADARPEVILLDAMMPGKSGLEALREIRGAGIETPVVMVSAHRDTADLREALALGAQAALTKPIDWAELLSTIEDLTG